MQESVGPICANGTTPIDRKLPRNMRPRIAQRGAHVLSPPVPTEAPYRSRSRPMNRTSDTPLRLQDRASAGYWLAFLALLALSVYLRTQQIGIQWLTDDEWHAVHKLTATDGYLPILLSYGSADYSIPLTVLYKFLSIHGGLTELKMRLPMLIGGTLFVALAMLWIRARLDARVALVFGFLLAVSPVLVNYSRYARPYMLTLLLVAIAVCTLARWERVGARRDAALYIACTWASSYLHLIMAPFAVGLLAPLFLRRMRRREAGSWRPLLMLSFLAVAGVLSFSLPPLLHDRAAMSDKTGIDLPQLDTLIGAGHIWFGTDSAAVVIAGIGLAVFGATTVWRRLPLELASWLCGCACIVVAIAALRPAYVQYPLILARYLLPLLPLLLLFVAAGIVNLAWRLPTSFPRGWIAAGASALFLSGTPHASLLRQPNNFTLHSYYQFDYRKRQNIVRQALQPYADPSPFWQGLAKAPPATQRIAIGGQPSFETLFVFHPLYQPLHRQLLFNLQTRGVCAPARSGEAYPSQGVLLRNAVSLESDADLQDKGIDWIVLESRIVHPYAPVTPAAHQEYLAECNRQLVARFGPPSYEDEHLKAYRIKRPDA